MADPVAALRRLLRAARARVARRSRRTSSRDYLAQKPKGKHGAHTYTFADVGLDEASVRETFARYVAHYGITEE